MSWLRCAALGAALVLPAADAAAAELQIAWRAPTTPEVAWRGIVETEGAGVGAGGTMLYPAPGLAGFLAAVLTHGALVAGAQNSERQKQQAAADRVLEPHLPALREWTAQALWESAMAKTGAPSGSPAAPDAGAAKAAWVGEAVPSFAMTQDAGALVLDVAIKLTPALGGAASETFVRVVSAPLQTPDAAAHWGAQGSSALKATAAAMLAHALELSSRQADPASAEEPPFRTHRYRVGNAERTERAQEVAGGCERKLLRTLRGWLLSVPVRGDAAAPCPDPYRI